MSRGRLHYYMTAFLWGYRRGNCQKGVRLMDGWTFFIGHRHLTTGPRRGMIYCITVTSREHPGFSTRVNNRDSIKTPRYWPFERGIHRSPMDSPQKGPAMRKAFAYRHVISWSAKTHLASCTGNHSLKQLRNHLGDNCVIQAVNPATSCIAKDDNNVAIIYFHLIKSLRDGDAWMSWVNIDSGKGLSYVRHQAIKASLCPL